MHKKSPPRPNEEDPSATNTGPSGKHSLNSADYPTALPSSKAIASQIALLALSGHHVIKGDMGDFTVCKYGLTRYCSSFAELQAFAKKLGVNHG